MGEDCKGPSSTEKWMISIMSGLLFFLIASPYLYSIVNELVGLAGVSTAKNGCPNLAGLILHSIVFVLIVRLMM